MKSNTLISMPRQRRKNQDLLNGQREESRLVSPDVVGRSKSYTCPMHPEVISDRPGKCPKCGMELVEKK